MLILILIVIVILTLIYVYHITHCFICFIYIDLILREIKPTRKTKLSYFPVKETEAQKSLVTGTS